MDKQALLKQLNNQLTELQKIVVDLNQSSQIHLIDIDMLKAKIRTLYEQTNQLINFSQTQTADSTSGHEAKQTDAIFASASTTSAPPQTAPTHPIPQAATGKDSSPAPTPTPAAPATPVTPTVAPATSAEIPASGVPQQAPTMTTTAPSVVPPPPQKAATASSAQPVKESVGDRLPGGRAAVNEVYGKAKATSKTTSNLQPVSDILIAIGLNDRFFFTRELFNNDSVLFKSTITVLNNLPDFEAAKNHLSTQFDWAKDNIIAEQFLQIVKRRYL